MKTKQYLLIVLSFLLIFTTTSLSLPETASADEAKTVYVGTQPDFPPFNFQDEKGNLTGNDLELLKKIFEKLPEYKLEFLPSSWDGITIGLDSNKTQIIADNMTWNEERNQKYNLSIPYYNVVIKIVVKKGRTDIKSLEDLKGKTLELVVGTTPALAMEKWNEENGNAVELRYTKATTYTDPLQDVAAGRVDAVVENVANLTRILKEQHLDIEAVGEPVLRLPVIFIFRKDELGSELKKKVDARIEELKADGTVKALLEEWLEDSSGFPN